ncbi:MAG TPA: phosphate ABC transporter permease subunit PstC [Geminicoccus sp.]|jgi:phosphate transport system permease protein|uniref:phosphate ABC transporter permease subunit PstC n=1 Tax=Geminicoccus sp. TaxID=2024832 RepID=UPI002E301F91|nr:phosphate ABC transporter permease subunit PstC [Geminicoccus sp.]HEX2525522.1 phosphate ABC transporter permease subunit PstC [Geminicoccus sp.]
MYTLAIILVMAAGAFMLSRQRAWALAGGRSSALHSRPGHYGWYAAMLSGGPAILVVLLWFLVSSSIVGSFIVAGLPDTVRDQGPDAVQFFMQDVRRIAAGLSPTGTSTPELLDAGNSYMTAMLAGNWVFGLVGIILAGWLGLVAYRTVHPDFRARNKVERWLDYALLTAAAISVLITAGIVFSVLFETLRFFTMVSPIEFFFGLNWSPQTAIRADQVGSSGAFGAVPLIAGTLLITAIAMFVAGPIGIMAAIWLSQYAPKNVRDVAKPLMEILAGIPTVVYGFFAALTVAPFLRRIGEAIGLNVASESALAAGVVMGIMIIPFVSSLSDDAINAVPKSLRDGSFGLGATKAETIQRVIVPAALPGIIAGFLLAISRAIGETMIVVMAAGLAANLTANPFAAVTTVTVQIVTLLVGDQEFDSAKTLAAFALGLFLFGITLVLNIVALYILQRFRERYD